jgi:hypothetical protein
VPAGFYFLAEARKAPADLACEIRSFRAYSRESFPNRLDAAAWRRLGALGARGFSSDQAFRFFKQYFQSKTISPQAKLVICRYLKQTGPVEIV